jgi:hypothetical protein
MVCQPLHLRRENLDIDMAAVLKEIESEDALKKRQQSQREPSPAPIAKTAPAPAEPPGAEAQATESTKGVFY